MRRLKLGSLITVVVVASGIGLTSVPAAVALPSLQPLTFTIATQSLTSSTHKHLTVAIVGTSISIPTPAQRAEGVTITIARKGAPEVHTWSFQLTNPNDFSWDTTTDTGVLNTGTSITPFGSLSLTLAATGHEFKTGCGRTKANVQPVTVRGSMSFNTRSGGKGRWGVVGGHSMTFTGQSLLSTLDPADKLCGSQVGPCVVTQTWQSFTPLPDSGYVQFRGTQTTLAATRVIHLSAPANSIRTDTTLATVDHTAFAFSGSNARTHIGPGGDALTGSARLRSTSENAQPGLACGNGHQLTADTQWAATYTNGKKPLVLHEQIEPNFTVLDSTTATIDKIVMV